MDSHQPDSTRAIDESRRAGILQELVETASSAANAQLDELITRLADALIRIAASTTDRVEARLRFHAATLLQRERYPFYYLASERLPAVLKREVQAWLDPSAPPSGSGEEPQTPPRPFAAAKAACIADAGRTLEAVHAQDYAVLNLRLARLAGRRALTTAQNPFRPEVFLSLIHDTWCDFHPDAETHHVVFPLLPQGLRLDMAPILQALNAALARHGIAAHTGEGVHGMPADSGGATQEAGGVLAQMLRRLFPEEEKAAAAESASSAGGLPALFDDEAVQALAARNAMLDYLERAARPGFDYRPGAYAQRRSQAVATLRELKRTAPPGALTPANESTIDLVAQIFDMVLRDAHIPDDMKTLIATLQLPVLKAALIDRDFFFEERHPARRVIELLAKLSVGWDPRRAHADPLDALIRRSVERIVRETGPRTSAFAAALQELESFVRHEESACEEALAPQIGLAVRQEKKMLATKAAKHEVALRIGTGEVVAFVETFLEDKWVTALTLAYGMKEEKPQLLQSAVKTMDDLCWSVKPKITPAERKEFLARLPGIVGMLNKWLDMIKWKDAERERFFTELAQCHAAIVRAPVELAPERQMQLAFAAARKAAERRMRRQAARPGEPQPDGYDEMAGRLERGAWLEFTRQDGIAMKVRLAWVSPMRSLYLFATRARQEAMSLSAEDLAQALRERRARIVAQAGLVRRALAEALGADDASNDACDVKSAA